MQSVTCTTITFEKPPKKPKKSKKPSNQERLLMLKANKIASQVMKKCRYNRAMREAFNDFSPPQMQSDDEDFQNAISTINAVVDQNIIAEFMAEVTENPQVEERTRTLTMWERLLSFFSSIGNSALDFKSYMASKASYFVDMMRDFAKGLLELFLLKKCADALKKFWEPMIHSSNIELCTLLFSDY